MTKALPLLLCACAIITFNSCKKDLPNNSQPVAVQTAKPVKSVDGYNTYFNWETATGMPVDPSTPVSDIPPMPWTPQSGSPISPFILNDYKSSDGWELVYNTFNNTVLPYASTQPVGGLYFALYNKYRGLLRFYLFIPPGYINNNSSIEHGLSIYSDNGTTTKLLNFDGQDVTDPNANTATFTKTNNTAIAYAGGWYAMQYQLAYDPQFSNPGFAGLTYPHLGFTWNQRTVSITQISLDGTQQGTITGNITQPSSGFNWSSTLINGIVGAAEAYGTAGASFLGQMGTNLTSAASGGLAGNVTGFLSGIFGGNSSNSQEVDLTMNTNISLAGTLSGSQPLTPNSLIISGQTASGNTAPLYTGPLGVFNISNRPQVQVTATETTQIGNAPYIQNKFTLLPSSYTVQINPAVSAIANVQVIQTDLLIPKALAESPVFGKSRVGMVQETIGDAVYYKVTSANNYLLGYDTPTTGTVVVRITVSVTPNNGAPASTITKSFVANITN